MKECKQVAGLTTNEDSVLFDKLYEIAGEESSAIKLYAYLTTDHFRNEVFGDYAEAYKEFKETGSIPAIFRGRVDNNFEPILEYDSKVGKHFFRDIDNERVFYPYERQGLNKFFKTNEIKSFARAMAFNYYEDYQSFNFDTLTFEAEENAPSLNQYVSEFIARKIDSLSTMKGATPMQMLKFRAMAKGLEHTKSLTKEWVQEITSVYNAFSVDVQEELGEEEAPSVREEGTEEDLMRPESFTKNSKNNVSNNIKLLISLVRSDERNAFGDYEFVPFDDIYTTINRSLANKTAVLKEDGNMEDLFDIYMEEFAELAKSKPYFKGLQELLSTQSELFKNQFVAAFRLSKNNYLGSEVIRHMDDNGHMRIEYLVRNLSEVGSRRSNLLQSWYFNFKQLKLNDKDNLRAIRNKIKNESIDNLTERTLPAAKLKLRQGLGMLGVSFTDKGYDMYIRGLKHGEVSPDEEIQTVLTTYRYLDAAIGNYLAAGNTNIFLDQQIFKDMSAAEAFFMTESSDASIYAIGKSKWVYSLESYIDQRINQWKKDVHSLYKLYKTSPYTQSSLYMKRLLAINEVGEMDVEQAIKNMAEVEVYNFNSVQNKGDAANAEDNKSLSETDSLADYVSKVLGHRKKGGKSYHKTALAADKATEYQIFYGNGLTFDTNTRYEDGQFRVNSLITNIFYDYFKGDYARMIAERKFAEDNKNNPEKLIPNYHTKNKNAFKSQIFPSLSIDYDKDTGEVKLPKLGFDLYNIDGSPKYTDLDIAENGAIAEAIKEEINKFISIGIGNTYDTLLDSQVLDYDNQGNVINRGIDSGIYNYYLSPTQGGIEQGANMLAGDLFINSVISQIEYSKMFTGDVAYYKDMTDYKKRVPASYTDGQYMRIVSKGDLYFNVSVIESVEVGSQYLDKLREMLPEDIANKYGYDKKGNGKINAADAQAWITPQRWKFIRHKLGKWDSTYDVIYEKMINQENPTYEPEELKKLAQPLKGVHFEINENGRPIFLKYSQAVMVPNLIRNTDLEILYNKMIEGTKGKDFMEDPDDYSKQIHELVTRDGIKVGYNTPAVANTKDGRVLADAPLSTMQLSNLHWKLQQDLNPKGPKLTDVGSQIQKVIFQGLVYNLDKDFYVGDETMTGDKLIEHLNGVISAMSNKGRHSVAKRLKLSAGKRKVINDEGALYNAILSNLRNRTDTPENVIKALEAGLAPLAIPGQERIFQNVFSTMVNDAMVKIKTNGGGFIQMSDFGLNRDEAKAQGIIFTPWFKDGSLHPPLPYKDRNGKDKIKPGGLFISGAMIAKYIPNYKDFRDKPEVLFGTLNEETGRYEGGMIDYDILQNIIGYRIPNQGLPSNDAFQILGILPEDVADTVVAYTGITSKTGSDFDIDKMYLMLPSFKAEYNTQINKYANEYIASQDITLDSMREQLEIVGYPDTESMEEELVRSLYINDVLLNDNSDNSDHYRDFHKKYDKKLGSAERLTYIKPVKGVDMFAQSPDALRNMLIEGFKAVLTSEHTIADVMNPIDIEFIEADIKNMFPAVKRPDLLDFDAVSDLSLKAEFRLGKAGLGQNVNSLVDSVRGAMANLYMYKYYIGRGKTVDINGDVSSKFDEEFSEELSDEDIRDYVADYNMRNPSNPTDFESIAKLRTIKLADSMTALVNGFADIAKDPYIVRGNWVTQTNNIGFMLLRSGVHPFYVNSFLGQPIIKDYVKFLSNSGSIIINDDRSPKEKFLVKLVTEVAEKDQRTNPDITFNGITVSKDSLVKRAIKYNYFRNFESAEKVVESTTNAIKVAFGMKPNAPMSNEQAEFVTKTKGILVDYVKEATRTTDEEGNEIDAANLSIAQLRKEITDRTPAIQMAVFDKFMEWQEQAKKLTKSVSASKIDVDGKGKNITSLVVSNNIINGLLDKDMEDGELSGFDTKLERTSKDGTTHDTFLNTYRKNALGFTYEIMRANPKYFLLAQPAVISTFNAISNSIRGENLQDSKLGDRLENAYMSYIMSGFKPLQTSREEKIRLLNELPDKLKELKNNPAYKKNMLISELYPRETETGGFSIAMPNLKKSKSVKDAITDGWRDLFESDPEFAEDLVKYSYLISGFGSSMNQFHEFIPYEWFNKNRFNSYLKRIDFIGKEGLVDMSFVDQFFRHNTEDTNLVTTVYDKEIDSAFKGDVVGAYKNTGIKINSVHFKHEGKAPYFIERIIRSTEDDVPDRSQYFTFRGYNPAGAALYLRTTPLGMMDTKGNKLVEYNFINGEYKNINTKSIVKRNWFDPRDIDVDRYKALRDVPGLSFQFPLDVMADASDTDYTNSDILEPSEEVIETPTPDVNTRNEEDNNEGPIIATVVTSMDQITNHSGGALGADSKFDEIGRQYGQTNHNHYYYGNKTPKGNVLLTDAQLQEGIAQMKKAAKILDKNPSKPATVNLLARNWFQVKNSTQVVAIARIADDMRTVEGGTGWAVAMAQANNKDINVFNLKNNQWYKWDIFKGEFVESVVPVLDKNFAGIGSREITPEGIEAIRDVYENTANTFITEQPVAEAPVVETAVPRAGDLVNYNNSPYLLWNINEAGKAQLIDIKGNKFSGTPAVNKLSVISSSPIVKHSNGTGYIVYDNRLIISTATGKLSFTADDNSTRLQRESILSKARGGNVVNTQDNVIEEQPKATSNYSFSYRGITIPTEFELGEEQVIALEKAIDHVEGRGEDPIVFTIEGYAGTGKTTIIGFLQKYLEAKGGYNIPQMKYIAPTHAATAQLAMTTARLGNKELPATLASTFYFDNKGGKQIPTLTFKAKEGFRDKIFVVDESSMISERDVAGFIAAIKDAGYKIIFMGDPKQIPEVSDQNQQAKVLSSVFTETPKAQLNRVYRQKKSTLLDVITHIRTANSFSSLIATETDGTLEILPNAEFKEMLIKDFMEDLDNTIYIAYTRRAVRNFNMAIKEILNGEKEPTIGEKIVGYGGYNNKQVLDGDIANSIQYTITGIRSEKRGGTHMKVITANSPILEKLKNLGVKKVQGEASSKYLQLSINDSFVFEDVTYEEMQANNEWLVDGLRGFYERIDAAAKQKKWKIHSDLKQELSSFLKGIDLGDDYFYDHKAGKIVLYMSNVHKNLPHSAIFKIDKGIDYGYGITAHKSQGMTIDNVYLDVANIQKSGRPTPIIDLEGNITNTEQNALYYVGMSRASKKVVINRDKTQFDRVIDTSDNSDPFKC